MTLLSPNLALFLDLAYSFTVFLAFFVANFEKFSKLVGQIVGQIRPCNQPANFSKI